MRLAEVEQVDGKSLQGIQWRVSLMELWPLEALEVEGYRTALPVGIRLAVQSLTLSLSLSLSLLHSILSPPLSLSAAFHSIFPYVLWCNRVREYFEELKMVV
jgi:hypothetical protein